MATILVVENKESLRSMLEEMLRGEGWGVTGVGSGSAAIERLRWVTGALKDTPVDERFGRGSLMPSVGCRAWLALCLGCIGEYSEAIAWGEAANASPPVVAATATVTIRAGAAYGSVKLAMCSSSSRISLS